MITRTNDICFDLAAHGDPITSTIIILLFLWNVVVHVVSFK
jgi:hypothetical protein